MSSDTPKYKICFLDVDGVINCQLFYEERHKRRKLTFMYWYYAAKSKLRWVFNGFKYKPYTYNPNDFKTERPYSYRIKRIKEETRKKRLGWLDGLCKDVGLVIVISSSWRNYFSLEEWNKVFEDLGCENIKVIGRTGMRETIRGDEIKSWLDENTDIVEDFIIIDDDSDFRPEQFSHFFWTDCYSGLTPTTCYKIKRYFEGYKDDYKVGS